MREIVNRLLPFTRVASPDSAAKAPLRERIGDLTPLEVDVLNQYRNEVVYNGVVLSTIMRVSPDTVITALSGLEERELVDNIGKNYQGDTIPAEINDSFWLANYDTYLAHKLLDQINKSVNELERGIHS